MVSQTGLGGWRNSRPDAAATRRATRDELEARVAKGYEATVEELLHPETPPAVDRSRCSASPPSGACCPAIVPMGNVNWMYHLVNTKRPLEERRWPCSGIMYSH